MGGVLASLAPEISARPKVLEKDPPGCGWGLVAAGQELHLYTVPLQIVSKSLSGESPPATIIANVDMLIG